MPRRSSIQRKVPVNHPAPLAPVPKPVVELPSLKQTVPEGFAFGAGSAIAHMVIGQTVGRLFNSNREVAKPTTSSSIPNDSYKQCMEKNEYDHELCRMLLNK